MEEILKAKKKAKNMSNINVNNFSLSDNVVIYARRVVVPATLKKRLLKEFHIDHPEISRRKSLMRSYVYWSTRDRVIEESMKV